jgi:translin
MLLPEAKRVTDLEKIAQSALEALEAKNAAREKALPLSRELVRHSANTIRAVHRGELAEAKKMLIEGRRLAQELKDSLAEHPDLYYSGYTQDALKELAEANITYALIAGGELPSPEELGVDYPAYLKGLGEAAGEMRRHILDLIRHGETERGEEILASMEDIYILLVTIDYPEAITYGLRRITDMVRGVLERTRGDLTLAIRQTELEKALKEFEERNVGK